MKTMDFVEVIKVSQRNINGNKVVNLDEENITRVSDYNFLTKALETYRGKPYKSDERVEEYIVANLPLVEDSAKQQWFSGITHNDSVYKAWFSTVGGMKQEDDGICDTIFIREDYVEFAKLVEHLVSLGKFTELENLDDSDSNKEICINKDVLSRLSLMTTDLIGEINLPNTIVLPNGTLDWVKDYKTVKPIKTTHTDDKGLETESVDYDLVDYHFNTIENEDDEIEIYDGCGLGTPKVFDNIGKEFGRTDIDFAIIRTYGNATKGLINKMDILGYMEETYQGDTDYCKLVDNEFYLLDYWGDWKLVTDNTILFNESMVKLAKMFDNQEEYNTRLNSLNTDTNRKYYNLLNKLYIAKVNKADVDVSDYRLTNYQLINGLALTPNDYYQLIERDLKLYKKILKPYEYDNDTSQFLINTDYINIFYRNISSVDVNDEDYKEQIYNECENIVDKTNELLNINQDYVKLKHTKLSLSSLVEKKIKEMASGRITVKANYQYMMCCPIGFMNYAMTREQGTNGLDEGQFYSSVCNDGDTRTISRNPLSAYSEIHNVNFIRNELLDKYLNKSKELIYFNQKSDIQNLLSGADFDGDSVLSVDNDIIRNAVVVPKDNKYFVNVSDGATKRLVYNEDNRFLSTFLASGNLIGKIALKAVSVNCMCQQVFSYYDTEQEKFVKRYDLLKQYEEHVGHDWGFDELIDKHLESGRFVYANDRDTELKELITQNYYDYEREIYIILQNGMSAIDSCKSLVFPSKADMQVINEKYFKNANFLKHTKQDEYIKPSNFVYTSSLLDSYASKIEGELLATIERARSNQGNYTKYHKELQRTFNNEIYNKDLIGEVSIKINELYKGYSDTISSIWKTCNVKNQQANLEYSELDRPSESDKAILSNSINRNNKAKSKAYNELDKEYTALADDILDNYDLATVCQSISLMKNCSENFIINLFFKCFKFVNETLNNKRYRYVEDVDGEIDYLFTSYTKVEVENFNNTDVIDRLETKHRVRNNIEQKVRFRLLDNSIINDIKAKVDNDEIYTLALDDKRIEMFEDFESQLEGLATLEVIKFDENKNGKIAIAPKSFGVIAKVS